VAAFFAGDHRVALVATGRPLCRQGVLGAFAYFSIIGLAFMLIRVRSGASPVYLGHPVYVLDHPVSDDSGGPWESRVRARRSGAASPNRVAAATSRRRVPGDDAVAAVSTTVGWGCRPNLVVTAFVSPLACALGCCFPLGLRLLGRHSDRLSAWMWGVNGACGVMASILAVMGSMWLGIHINLLVAAALYALLAPFRRLAAR
jgi:hypothetical protein